ncbi:MAG: class I SAM-dependent methyltransferase [Thermosynechococcaceae cyanobacterium]
MRRNPFPDPFQLKIDLFDRWAPWYDTVIPSVFYRAIHQRLLASIQLPPAAKVLDLGCGTGQLLNRLAGVYPDLQGFGLDLSPEMIRQARRKILHRPRLIFVQGRSDRIPFAAAEFDAVFCTISFLHYPDPLAVLREVRRVLKPQGRFYLADFAVAPSGFGFRTVRSLAGGVKFYNESERDRLGQQAGLVVSHAYLLGPVLLSIFTKPHQDATERVT